MKKIIIALLVITLYFVPGCRFVSRPIDLVDAKIVAALDENIMPVEIKNVFPVGTSKVSCWFKWRNAEINTQVLAKWHYVTDDIHIIDSVVDIPKKSGTGGLTLAMPDGRRLPAGSYKVELFAERRLLKTLTFRIE